MKYKKDLTNNKFGRLVVVSYSHTLPTGHSCWNCKCKCGKIKTVRSSSLLSGHSNSCGCLAKEKASILAKKLATTHGMCSTSEYRSWKSMRRRCYDSNNKDYKYYGARGITVCNEWKTSFETFIKDMGKKPSKTHTIHRKDNDLEYSPQNCIWATAGEHRATEARLQYFSDQSIINEFYRRFPNGVSK